MSVKNLTLKVLFISLKDGTDVSILTYHLSLITNSSTIKINEYKNSISMSMDSIHFVDVNQNKKNLDNLLYVINGKISNKKAMELILPDNIKSVNILKGIAENNKGGYSENFFVIAIDHSLDCIDITKLYNSAQVNQILSGYKFLL